MLARSSWLLYCPECETERQPCDIASELSAVTSRGTVAFSISVALATTATQLLFSVFIPLGTNEINLIRVPARVAVAERLPSNREVHRNVWSKSHNHSAIGRPTEESQLSSANFYPLIGLIFMMQSRIMQMIFGRRH